MTEDEKNESLCTWLLSISNGKLFHPSDEFVRDGQDMENEFMNFHACPKRVDMKPNVIDRFTDVLVKKFGEKYDKEVYELFARTRTHIRIKDLNKAEMLTILFFRIYDPIPILLSKVDLQSDPILSPS